MHFLLKKNLSSNSRIKIIHFDNYFNQSNIFTIQRINQKVETYSIGKKYIYILGDLITELSQERSFDLFNKAIQKNLIHRFGGFFYLVYIDLESNQINIFSSLFNILPVYYCVINNEITVSSNIGMILKSVDRKFSIDKQYILERVLFNYSLFNRTYFQELKLLKSNHYLNIDENVKEKKQFDITDLYVKKPKKGRKVLNQLADLFIKCSEKYFPDEKYALSFTGGFDGRTLLSVSKYFGKDFFTYSFGSITSEDLIIPKSQAKDLNIEFKPFYLDEKYISNESFNCGIALIEKTEGNASFSRAHYLYSVKNLSKDVKYILTGNFGSELFRAMHNHGVMISQELINIFKFNDEEWIKLVKSSNKLNYLNKSEFEKELEQVIKEIIEFKNEYSGLSTNEFFYVYVLNEVFRKYFGPEIYMQRYYLNNRSPFLDFGFIEELFATNYCGIYSDFLTSNPIKRFKGQLIYSHIIKKTYSPLLNVITGKGYKPKSLLTKLGKIELVTNLIRKKITKNNSMNYDSFSVERAFRFNNSQWSNTQFLSKLYNTAYIKNKLKKPPEDRDTLYNIISINNYLSKKNINVNA